MTTLVYDHESNEIATDGRMCCGGDIVQDYIQKYFTAENGDIVFFSGSLSDVEVIKKSWAGRSEIKLESRVGGFLVRGCKAFFWQVSPDGYSEYPMTCSDADGSGGGFAMSALDLIENCSAEDAVGYASTRDAHTGGGIVVYGVGVGEFLKGGHCLDYQTKQGFKKPFAKPVD